MVKMRINNAVLEGKLIKKGTGSIYGDNGGDVL
jgi:hypothetical protein